MTFRRELHKTVIGLGAFLLASQSHAIAISDATIRNSFGSLETSTAATLGAGKVKNATINGIAGLFTGDEWSLLDRTNKPSKPLNDVNFLLAAATGQRSGEWGMSWVGTGVPDYMDYVLVLKSGKQWGAYLFESANLGPDLQDLGGTFAISWLNKKGKIPKLRHASIFGRTGSAPALSGYSHVDTAGTSGAHTVTSGNQTGGSGNQGGIPGVLAGVAGGQTGTPGTGTQGDQTGSPADVSLGPDTNSVPIPGTLALLAIGLGLGLRQLQQNSEVRSIKA